jgi:hypothetical protein
LGGTLAPFVNPEKPQVSPWPAASFIKKYTIVCISGLAGVEPCHARQWTRQIIAIGGCPCIYYIFLLFRWDGIRAIAGPGKSGAGNPGDGMAPLKFAAYLGRKFD